MQANRLLRIDPNSPCFWRKSGSFVIGYPDVPSSNALEINRYPKQIATWLALIDGTRTRIELIQSGTALGIPLAALQELLERLSALGHLQIVESLPAEAAIGRSAFDLKFQAHLSRISLQELLQERADFGIEILGAGILPARIFQLLNQNAFSVGWQPNSNRRIRLEDEAGQIHNYKSGRRWSELAVAIHQPKLQIVCADSFDPELGYREVIQLPIIWHSRRVAMGPVLNFPNQHTANCLHQLRMSNDPEWSFVLTQLLHNDRPLPVLANPWLELAAQQVLALVSRFAAGQVPPEILQTHIDLIPPNPFWKLSEEILKCQDCDSAVA